MGRKGRDPGPFGAPLRWLFHAAIASMLLLVGTAAGADDDDGIVINKLDELLDLGTWSGTGDIEGVSHHCVVRVDDDDDDDDSYSLTIAGDGPGGAFQVRNGSGDSLRYHVSYSDQPANAFVRVEQPGSSLDDLVGQTLENPDQCQQNQRVKVQFRARDLIAVPAGSYSGTLTLVVTAD